MYKQPQPGSELESLLFEFQKRAGPSSSTSLTADVAASHAAALARFATKPGAAHHLHATQVEPDAEADVYVSPMGL